MLNLLSAVRARFLLATFGPRGFRTVGCQQSHAEFVALKASLKNGLKSAVPFNERGCAGVSNPGVALADREKIWVDDVDVLRRRLTDAVQGGSVKYLQVSGRRPRWSHVHKKLVRKTFDLFNPNSTNQTHAQPFPPREGGSEVWTIRGAYHTGPHAGIFFSRRRFSEAKRRSRKSKSRIVSTAAPDRTFAISLFISLASDDPGAVKSLATSVRDRRPRRAHLFASFEGIFFDPTRAESPRWKSSRPWRVA